MPCFSPFTSEGSFTPSRSWDKAMDSARCAATTGPGPSETLSRVQRAIDTFTSVASLGGAHLVPYFFLIGLVWDRSEMAPSEKRSLKQEERDHRPLNT